MNRRSLAGWRLALRYAWRSSRASARRTAVLALLVALPMAATVAFATLKATATPTAEERATHALGAAAIRVAAEHASAPPLASVFPAGSRTVRWSAAQEHARANGRDFVVLGVTTDLRSPLVDGIFGRVAGAPPVNGREVVLSPTVADRLGVRVGDAVTLGAGRYTVVGLYERADATDMPLSVRLPTARDRGAAGVGWLVSVPPGEAEDAARAARATGFSVLTRSEAGAAPAGSHRDTVTAVGLELLALLEVGLLVGAAFALVAKRQRRELALLAAVGASPRDLRRVMLMFGAIVAVLGSALGLALGIAAAAALKGVAERAAHQLWGPLEPAWAVAAVAAALGAAVALAASTFAARAVSGLDVWAALRGVGAPFRSGAPTRMGHVHLAAFAAAAALVVVGIARHSPQLAAIGCLAALLAGAASLDHLLRHLGARGRELPLSLRLVLRDASGSPGRATALATCVASLFVLALTVTAVVFGMAARSERQYVPDLPTGMAALRAPSPVDRAALASAATSLRATRVATVAFAEWTLSGSDRRTLAVLGSPLTRCLVERGLVRGGDAQPCADATGFGIVLPQLGVSGPQGVEAVLGRRLLESERRSLAAGRALVLNRHLIDESGRVALELPLGAPPLRGHRLRLPAVLVASDRQFVTAPVAFVSPAALRGTPLAVSERRLVLFDGPPPSREVEDRARDALVSAGQADDELFVERGPAGRSVAERLLPLVALALVLTVALIAVTSVILAAAEMTQDLAVLAAVGAPGRLRKRLAAVQAAALAGGGALAGTALGAVAAVTVTAAQRAPLELAPYAGVLLAAALVLATAGVSAHVATPARMPVPTAME